MISPTPSRSRRFAQPLPSPYAPGKTTANRPGESPFLDGFSGWLLTVAGTLLVVLIACLDLQTQSRFSFALFFLVPVAVCAWRGGLAHGILLALVGSVAWYTIDCLETQAGVFGPAGWNCVVRFGMLVLVSSLISRLRIAMFRERQLARTDPLTGAVNGRTFYETVALEAERARRAGRPLTLAYFDLDNFKQLNDRFGHAVGDAALLAVVKTFHHYLRRTDVLARLGGDEFALLLPETGADGVVALLGRIQGLLASETACKGWPVRMSIGAATFLRPPTQVERMIQHVDDLMYDAKRKGKGGIEHVLVRDDRAGALNRPHIREQPSPTGGGRHPAARGPCAAEERVPGYTLLLVEPCTPGVPGVAIHAAHPLPGETKGAGGSALAPHFGASVLRCWMGEQPDANGL